ncbi:PIN domain-containing protein [Nocardia farcinica]|uniref:PIN domain-containing protein n=1 Tax=Nocardia farcinica TaxID=37329 RepID=UPI001892EBBC|nr:PIN domain-containing protein [Nocardia farcinica]MBF6359415.1 PIN domain-containing protein [Nocardia farcinica]
MSFFIADTSALIAAYDNAAAQQEKVRTLLASSVAVVSPLVLDEVDHLLVARFGKDRRVADLVLDDLLTSAEEGAILVSPVDHHDLRVAQRLINQFGGLRLDLADAVNVVLAERYLTNVIVTLDERDFRALAPLTPSFAAFHLPIQDGESE